MIVKKRIMKKRIIRDNECYEIDLECVERRKKEEELRLKREAQRKRRENTKGAR